ncbi:archaetidylserine decarboxylase [Chitinibacter tainanensis]|uniref:archaetidylserine decarboxylase n=1 Tax=Chitinibacter tainanensis TaxID=230667 RepID=UPI0023549C5C|nr:archaetidylserine decarboxylase [Chitinibacter tainanensis]
MSDRLFVALQHVLPKRLLTELLGNLAGRQAGSLTTQVIKSFIAKYQVNMAEAANPDPASYATFNEFFTRPLKAGARPIDSVPLVCPVDGAISQLGKIEQEQIFQAKGRQYTATALLGGDAALAAPFRDGQFATIYLSPKDYHRIHMPCRGRLTEMIYVPGELYSVNPATARGVDALFARNERVVCMFDSEFGSFALVLVGATIVGSMATVWHGVVNPPRANAVWRKSYLDQQIVLEKGEEMGRFLLGSTVVLLFQPGTPAFAPDWVAARPVRLGEMMAA